MKADQIPFTEFSQKGKFLHFAHANGYHPLAYSPLINELKENYRIIAMHLRPFWGNADPNAIHSWEPFTQDLLAFLDVHSKGAVIGTGHSIGATITMLAALQQPQRFQALVLFDPVIFPKWMGIYWKIAFKSNLAYRLHPLTKNTLKRRRVYPSREAMFASYRKKPVFAYISDDNLRIIIEALTTIDAEGNAVLKYAPEWEARIYATSMLRDGYIWKHINRLEVPLLIIYSENSNAFWESSAKTLQRKNPNIHFERIPNCSHLVPLEKPKLVAALTKQFLDGILDS